jgi:hypothetical protein
MAHFFKIQSAQQTTNLPLEIMSIRLLVGEILPADAKWRTNGAPMAHLGRKGFAFIVSNHII